MSYENPTSSTGGSVSDLRLQTKLLLDTGAAIGKAHPATGGPRAAPYVTVPEGYRVVATPERTVPDAPGTAKLRDATSFILFVNAHKLKHSRIYATLDPARFLAVIDDYFPTRQGPDEPESTHAWREFRADFKVPQSREWIEWNSKDGSQMSQKAFAQFIEDNLPDVIKPDGATLLEMSLNFEAAQAGHFIATQRLQDGSHNLQWKADNNATGTVKLPESITLAIPVFENEAPQQLSARLRYRVAEGKLSIWYELIRPHKVIEAAFMATWKRIATETGLPILLGTPE